MIFHPQTKIILGNIEMTALDYIQKLPLLIASKDLWISETGLFLRNYMDTSPDLILQSSGTTQYPKSISILKSRMNNSAIMTGRYFLLNPGTSALLSLPITYIAGKMMVVRALSLGLTLHIVKPSSDPFLDNPLLPFIDFAPFVPLQLQTMLENEVSRKKVSTIRKILLGGAGIDNVLVEQIKLMPNEIYESFGMTETLSHVALRKINDKNEQIQAFNALPDVTFTMDDRDCLIIHCPTLLDSPFITNDVVKLNTSTSFQWEGRFDNMINSGGIKIFPENLEKQLAEIIPVNFCIVSLPDERLGQQLVLVIEYKNSNNLDVEQLLDKMKGQIEQYLLPKAIYCIPQLLRNPHGKILRHLIVARIITHAKEITRIYPK